MDLMYTEEEERFRLQLREFLEQELRSLVEQIEEEELSPTGFIQKLGARGYLGSTYPQWPSASGVALPCYLPLSPQQPSLSLLLPR